jgi:hypothetical protein
MVNFVKKMKKSKIKEALTKSIEQNQHLSFFRKFASTRIHGYVLDFTDNFVLIHQTSDLKLDGFAILPLKTIKKVRHNEFEEMHEYIMQAEQLLTNLGINYPIDLTNWQTILNSIKTNNKITIIECEQVWIKLFLLGELTKVKKKKVEIRYLEANGIFEEFVTEQKYKDITIVRFDETYSNLFQKYARYKNQVLPKVVFDNH